MKTCCASATHGATSLLSQHIKSFLTYVRNYRERTDTDKKGGKIKGKWKEIRGEEKEEEGFVLFGWWFFLFFFNSALKVASQDIFPIPSPCLCRPEMSALEELSHSIWDDTGTAS